MRVSRKPNPISIEPVDYKKNIESKSESFKYKNECKVSVPAIFKAEFDGLETL